MTVQTSAGNITIGPGDFQRTDRGVTWAIKCRDIQGIQVVVIVIKQPDGSWASDGSQESSLESAFDIHVGATGGDVIRWFNEILVPALNRWLWKVFPPVAQGGSFPPVGTAFEQADALIHGIKITVNADGTLTAS